MPLIKTHLGYNVDLLLNLIVFSLFFLVICGGCNLLITLFKPRIKQNTNFHLYAFATGLLIIIGTIGLLREGIEKANLNFPSCSFRLLPALLVISGAATGLVFTISTRAFLSKRFKSKHIHVDHSTHNHSDHIINAFDIDNPKAAWFVISLLLVHRTIDGFTMGALVPKMLVEGSSTVNYGFFIAFGLHIVFETIFIYYRQVQYGQKKWRALLYNFYTLIALVVVVFIGGFLYEPINQLKWVIPFANGFGGIVISFVSIIEIVPEFIHFRNIDAKRWYFTISWFGIGMIIALGLIAAEDF